MREGKGGRERGKREEGGRERVREGEGEGQGHRERDRDRERLRGRERCMQAETVNTSSMFLSLFLWQNLQKSICCLVSCFVCSC